MSTDSRTGSDGLSIPLPTERTADLLRRALFPLGIATVVVLVVAVSRYLGAVAAAKGLYALLGLLAAAGLYYGFGIATPGHGRTDGRFDEPRVAAGAVVAAVVVALACLVVAAPSLVDRAVGWVVASVRGAVLSPAGIPEGVATVAGGLVGSYGLLFLAVPVVLVVAAALYRTVGVTERASVGGVRDAYASTSTRTRSQWYGKLAFVAAGLAVALAGFTGERVTALVTFVPLAYALVGLQLFGGASPRWILAQATALFAVAPLTKYLTTGFYFGPGDNLVHVAYVSELLATGRTAGLERYADFPGLHAIVGSFSLAGGIPPYDALLLSGILLYTVLVPLMYLLVVLTTDDARLAAFVAVAVTLMQSVSFHATYFFPQALGMVFVMFVVYLTFRLNALEWAGDRVAATSLTALVFLGLVVTHHLTFVLVAPMLVLVVAVPAVARVAYGEAGDHLSAPRAIPLTVGGVLALAYWGYRSEFLAELVTSFIVIVTAQLFAGSGGKPISAFAVDTTIPVPDVATALASLASPDGLYLVALLVVFVVGVVAVLAAPRQFRSAAALLVAGVVASVLVFRTPLAITDLGRLRLPMSFFFAVVVGVGLYALFDRGVVSVPRLTAVLLVLVVVGSGMPLAAGDDLYGVNAGANLYELYPTPEPQSHFEWDEYSRLGDATRFVAANEQGGDVTTAWLGKEATSRHFGGVDTTPFTVTEAGTGEVGLVADRGLVLHRSAWTDHSVILSAGGLTGLSELSVSDRWVHRTEATENKVYSTGSGVSLLWQPESDVLGEFEQTLRTA